LIKESQDHNYEPVLPTEGMLWLTVAAVLIAMIFLTMLVKGWKSLPEE
jgi:hypothetical protein